MVNMCSQRICGPRDCQDSMYLLLWESTQVPSQIELQSDLTTPTIGVSLFFHCKFFKKVSENLTSFRQLKKESALKK